MRHWSHWLSPLLVDGITTVGCTQARWRCQQRMRLRKRCAVEALNLFASIKQNAPQWVPRRRVSMMNFSGIHRDVVSLAVLLLMWFICVVLWWCWWLNQVDDGRVTGALGYRWLDHCLVFFCFVVNMCWLYGSSDGKFRWTQQRVCSPSKLMMISNTVRYLCGCPYNYPWDSKTWLESRHILTTFSRET